MTDEVRRQRQHADHLRKQHKSLTQNRYNTLSSFTSSAAPKPINKSLSLFFFRKGSSCAILHGSPMIIQLYKSDRIENWQEYLQVQVQDHPAWWSFPPIRTQEIDPSKLICVGYWEGGNTLPNANQLIGNGSIVDLLKLVDNPKSNTILSQHGGIKARRPNESIRVGYTVHIRNVGNDSEEDSNANRGSSPSTSSKEIPPTRWKRHQKVSKLEPFEDSEAKKEDVSSASNSDSEDARLALVKQERNILPIRPTPFTQTLRPSTPAQALGGKQSLTILSPERISLRTTIKLKKTRSATALAIVTPGDTLLQEGDDGDKTDNDFELGFQFLN